MVHIVIVGSILYIHNVMQVNLQSTNLEAHLYTQGLLRLLDMGVKVAEIVTDAHIQIASLMSIFQDYCVCMYVCDSIMDVKVIDVHVYYYAF